ncbi:MAG: hypothetical protein GY849_06085, partial [Deltaproteobacteria bacterium]|nr:hypothetical protein [Deltaproteobacteria bacterium]
ARSPQFDLLDVHPIDEKVLPSARVFGKGGRLPDRAINDLRSDVYIVGQAQTTDPARVVCQVKVWGITGATGAYDQLEPLSMDKSRLFWKMNLTKSGSGFFHRAIVDQSERLVSPDEDVVLGQVIFLTQPISDELDDWVVKDGLIIPRPAEEMRMAKGAQYGRVMQSRRKGQGSMTGTDYVIKGFKLMLKEKGKDRIPLESYVLPRTSDYFHISAADGTGYRFGYTWFYPNRGTRSAPASVGKGWKFNFADPKWSIQLPWGRHEILATFTPVVRNMFGKIVSRPDYFKKFYVLVKPGLNIYVVNYAYHRDIPRVFVRRLVITEGTWTEKTGTTMTMSESRFVYGSD